MIVTPLVKKFSGFHATWRFIAISTQTHHWFLSCANWIQSASSHPLSFENQFIVILPSMPKFGLGKKWTHSLSPIFLLPHFCLPFSTPVSLHLCSGFHSIYRRPHCISGLLLEFMPYYKDGQINEDEMGRACTMHWWENCIWLSINIDLKEIGWEIVSWIHLVQDGPMAGCHKLDFMKWAICWLAKQLLAS
jgi:hypothetical protein